ncbi:MAG: beta-ketoacyl synthase chain length factor [Flavobacteriaceae bacterium]|jgi:3-oxoacyl-(acyl-carrier-protein) synthase|nr:beta-ketoacyl synthase chain length factor [Flavobacteriaceae bacterium]
MRVFINGVGSVSFQEQAKGFKATSSFVVEQGINVAKQPSYKDLIPAAMIRRMAKGVKMGIYASHSALNEANIAVPEAIITGTGLGCLLDSEKFLQTMLENNESYLTPTSFIQSTHNTVGAQIALQLQCTGYNFTYVHQNVSFESALVDAMLQLQSGELSNVLIGGIDEIAPLTMHFFELAQKINTPTQEYPNGVNYGEGATFMLLNSQASDTTYAEVVNTTISNTIDSVTTFITSFLHQNDVSIDAIDVLVVGSNGTANDGNYFLQAQQLCAQSAVETYKQYTGEYHTASAFGLLIASQMLKEQCLFSTGEAKQITYVLVYNQFNGKDHSLTLLRKW